MNPLSHLIASIAVCGLASILSHQDLFQIGVWILLGSAAGTLVDVDHFLAYLILTRRRKVQRVKVRNLYRKLESLPYGGFWRYIGFHAPFIVGVASIVYFIGFYSTPMILGLLQHLLMDFANIYHTPVYLFKRKPTSLMELIGVSVSVILVGQTFLSLGLITLGFPEVLPTVLPLLWVTAPVLLYMSKKEVRISRYDRRAMYLWICFILLTAFTLVKYPVFPRIYSRDYIEHLSSILRIAEGSQPPVKWLYSGVHLFLAPFLVNLQTLAEYKLAMMYLLWVSPPLVYLASLALFKSKETAFTTTVFYVLTSPLWYYTVFSTGLLANFYAMLIGFIALSSLNAERSWRKLLHLPPLTFLLSISHYSILTLLATLSLGAALLRRERKAILLVLTPMVLGGAFIYVSDPELIGYLTSLATGKGLTYHGGGVYRFKDSFYTPLLPTFWKELAYQHASPLLFPLTIILTAMGVVWTVKRGNRWGILLSTWLALTVFLGMTSPLPFRYSYVSLQPMLLLSGYGLSTVWSRLRKKLVRILIPGVILLSLLTDSHLVFLLSDTATATGDVMRYEQGFDRLIQHIRSSYSREQGFILVYEWRAMFLKAFGFGKLITEYPTEAEKLWKFSRDTGSLLIVPRGRHLIQGRPVDILFYYTSSGLFTVEWSCDAVVILRPVR